MTLDFESPEIEHMEVKIVKGELFKLPDEWTHTSSFINIFIAIHISAMLSEKTNDKIQNKTMKIAIWMCTVCTAKFCKHVPSSSSPCKNPYAPRKLLLMGNTQSTSDEYFHMHHARHFGGSLWNKKNKKKQKQSKEAMLFQARVGTLVC